MPSKASSNNLALWHLDYTWTKHWGNGVLHFKLAPGEFRIWRDRKIGTSTAITLRVSTNKEVWITKLQLDLEFLPITVISIYDEPDAYYFHLNYVWSFHSPGT